MLNFLEVNVQSNGADGFKIEKFTPRVKGSAAGGNDLTYTDVDKASGLTPKVVECVSSKYVGLNLGYGRVRTLKQALIDTHKFSDKVVTHATTNSRWHEPYVGSLVLAGIFTLVALQTLVLEPAHSGMDPSNTIYGQSRDLLSARKRSEYMNIVGVLTKAIQKWTGK